MYEYVRGKKFPIQEIEDLKALLRKQAQQLKTEDAQVIGKANKAIEQEHQNLEEVTPKMPSKVTPKDIPNIPTSQRLEEDSNSESDTQNDKESNTQREDLILNEGWVPLFRKSMKSQVFQNEGLWKVWTWCLMKASHIEQWVSIRTGKGLTEVHLLPGQFIFGRKTASKELKMKESTVWKRIVKLKNMQNLNTQSNTHCSVITLINWGFYRELMKTVTEKGTGKEQARDTYKKNKKNIYSLNSNEFRLSELLLSLIFGRRNTFKKPDLQKWARHIDLMIRVDERDPGEIEKVINWCQGDPFWQNIVLSTTKLRDQFDQLAMKMGKGNNAQRQEPEPPYYKDLT